MRKFRTIFIIILLLLAGAAAWYFLYKKEDQPISLITENPVYGYISKSVTATGTIQPVDTVSVGAQVSGTISAIYTDFNAKVRKGQLLAEMDKVLFQAQVNQYKANLAVANSSLVYNKSNFDRQTLLYNTGAISKADFENAQNLYQSAKANVASVQAQLDASIKNLSYTSIYSPVDGVVMTRNISVGQTVASSFNTPTLFIIAKDISRMQVQAAVSEADIGDVRVGLRSTFTVDAYPDITFTGNVSQIRLEPVVTSNVVTYTTIITAPNEDLKLRPGMTANIFVFTREVDSALLISAKALKFKPDDALAKQFTIQADSHHIASAARKSAGQGAQGGQGSSGQSSLASSGQGSARQGSPAPPHIHDTSAHKIDSTGQKPTYGYVWIRQGDTIAERRIRTGLNNDTQVQVLAGLSVNDEIVTGEEIPVKGSSAKSGAVKSPFMPARRPSGGGAKPAAGGK
jgi:HlyD family secretion protein